MYEEMPNEMKMAAVAIDIAIYDVKCLSLLKPRSQTVKKSFSFSQNNYPNCECTFLFRRKSRANN